MPNMFRVSEVRRRIAWVFSHWRSIGRERAKRMLNELVHELYKVTDGMLYYGVPIEHIHPKARKKILEPEED